MHGHVKIRSVFVNGATVNVARDASGRFNFDDLLPAPSSAQPAARKEPLSLPRATLDWLDVRKLDVFYVDAAQNLSVAARNVMLGADRVSLNRRFRLIAKAETRVLKGDIPADVTLALSADADLAGLHLPSASVLIPNIILRYRETPFVLKGTVKNFQNPDADLTLEITNLSEQTLADVAPGLPPFLIPFLKTEISATADLTALRAVLRSLRFTMPGVEASASGSASFAAGPSYQADADFRLNLDELASVAALLAQDYQITGDITGGAWTDGKDWNAHAELDNVGALLPFAGRLKGFKTAVTLDGLKKLAVKDMAGYLNDGFFDGYITAVNKEKYIDAVVHFNAEKLTVSQDVLARAAAADRPEEPSAPAAENAPAAAPVQAGPAFTLPPVNLRALITTGPGRVPYIYAKSVSIKTNLKGLSAKMGLAQGTAEMNIGEGEIQDIYKLTEANAVTKAMFLSLSVVSRVINSLNVLDLFAKLMPEGGAEEATTSDGRKLDGKMNFESFSGALNFKNGVMNMKKGSFVSDMMSLNISGNTDFRTNRLNMQVNAAPGKHYDDGIMPITLKIGGTVEEPQGSMSMLASAASLVTQTVGNNFASNAVKKGVGGFFGLFKKKKEQAQEPFPAQEDAFIEVDPQQLLEEAAAHEASARNAS